MATRYAGDFEFDHGAQFFTARTDRFRAFLKPLIDDGIVASWNASFVEFDGTEITSSRHWEESHPHFVGVPRMNSIAKALSAGVNVQVETTISSIERDDSGWILSHRNGASAPYDWLVLAAPAAQSGDLAEAFPELARFSGKRQMLGCYAMMLGFEEPLELEWQAALVRNADISWVSVNSSKPGRAEPYTMVVHSTNAWAEAHMEDDTNFVLQHMLDVASSVTGQDLQHARHRKVHRWRYANIGKQEGPTHYIDQRNALAACGDWCVHGRIEAAFTSAYDLAESLKDQLR
jgi:predicted NAD/FAD-dependent oxidoreductase